MPDTFPAGTQISHYRVESLLGAGGMGEVYLAHDLSLDRSVALKVLPRTHAGDASRSRRLIQEAQTASAINHPNVCVIHEVGKSNDGRSFIAMEYVEGELLSSRIKAHPFNLKETVEIGIQVADALEEAHSKGIIHRDIKPSNIVITPRGQAKVLDFGLARMAPLDTQLPIGDRSTQARTKPGILLGTVEYMSPEQALGREVDARSDIFSFGVVLFEMATGRRPFTGNNPLDTIDRIAHAEPEPVSRLNKAVSPGLRAIISKCLEKDPQRRYQSARELMLDLVALKEEARPRLNRNARLVLALLGALLVLPLIPSVQQLVSRWFGLGELPSEKYVAVLPFHIVGDDPTCKAFADGLMETITSKLSELEQFQQTLIVVPAADVRERGVTSVNTAQATFGVTLAISGSVQREGNRVRLTLNLSDAKTLRQVWSSVDDYILTTNLPTLQDGVIVKLARMLDLGLRPQMHQVIAAGRTSVPDAYDFYLQGRGYLQRYDKAENLDLAAELFTRAVQRDPDYALAYAGLGELYWRKYEATLDTQWIGPAVANSQKAAQLNDQLPSVHVTLGLIYTGKGQLNLALAEFQQALNIDRDNDDAQHGLARAYEASGDLKEAEEAYVKAIALKPAYWAGYARLAHFYDSQRRYKDAINYYSQVIALTPDSFKAYSDRGAMYVALERWAEARRDFERSLAIKATYAVYSNLGTVSFYEERYSDAAAMYAKAVEFNAKDYWLWGNLASAHFWTTEADRKSEARAAYEQAARLAEEILKVNPSDAAVLTNLSQYYAMLGRRDKALPLLNRALDLTSTDNKLLFRAAEIYEQLGYRQQALSFISKALEHGYSKGRVERSPTFHELRADSDFRRLLQAQQQNLKR